MQVTQIVELTKNRSKVFIDYEFAFVLYKGELRLYHIAEGQEISETDYGSIMADVLPKRAKLRCLNLLKSRDYTKAQLQKKLEEGGYPDEIIRQALSYVEGYGYVNDEKYAGDYIACYAALRSRIKIEYELLKKGIAKDTIEKAWQMWQESGNEQDEEQMIQELLRKKNWNPEEQDVKTYQKMMAFLLRKGFCMESIRKAMKNWGK